MNESGTDRIGVARIVSSAHRTIGAVRAAESALVGSGGAGCLLAASLWSGGRVESFETWLVALACGALAAIAFWRSKRVVELDTARQLDAHLGAHGGLVTAFESAGSGPLASLLESRVAAGISRGRAMRAVLPLSVLPIVAPFVGAVLFAVARESVSEPRSSTLSDLTSEISDRLIRSGGRALDEVESDPEVDPAEIDRDLSARLRDLARSVSSLDSQNGVRGTDELLDDLARIDRDIRGLESGLSTDSEVASNLRAASLLLDAVRMRLARADGRSDPSAANVQSSRAAGSGAHASGVPEVASSTVSGDAGGSPPTLTEFAATEAGWWSSEFDSVVTDWIERRVVSGGKGGNG